MGIVVKDRVMGSHKTSDIIKEINNRTEQDRYNNPMLVIVPLITEVERFKEACIDEDFKEPQSSYDTVNSKMINKGEDILKLLSKGESICTTHALFDMFTDEVEYQIKINNYNVVLDEEVVTIKPLLMSEDERIRLFVDSNYATIEPDTGICVWTGPRHQELKLDTKTLEYRRLMMARRVVIFNGNAGKMFIIQTPPSFFKLVDSYIILTYMFSSSDLCAFFEMYSIKYRVEHQDKEIEREYKQKIKSLITFVDPPKPVIELSKKRKTNFSSSHWDSLDPKFFVTLRRTLGEKLKRKGIDKEFMVYACKKSFSMQSASNTQGKHLSPRGYQSYTEVYEKDDVKTEIEHYNWIPYNSKATNKYSFKTFIVYMHNVYRNVHVSKYVDSKVGVGDFEKRTTENNEDYALSVMLQCIWRTAIRNDDPISVMIFSDRMKNLFIDWLNN